MPRNRDAKSPRMKVGEAIALQYWPHDKPLPKGARFVSQLPGHHSRYSVLIELPEESPKRRQRMSTLRTRERITAGGVDEDFDAA